MSSVATDKLTNEEEFVGWIQAAQRNERQAFDRLYELFADRIFRYLYYRVGDQQLAEDLTADVFVRLLEKIQTFRLGQRDQTIVFSAWLYRIAHNRLVDHLRKQSRSETEPLEAVTLSHDETPDVAVEVTLEQEELVDAISTLTLEQKQVVVLRFLEGYRIKEVAGIMGRSEGAIKALQHRALNALHRQMAREAR